MSLNITILAGKNTTTTPATMPQPPKPTNVDTDFIVILAAFICALICVLGLIAIARCTWLRRLSGVIITGGRTDQPPIAANKGVKKKVLKTLPKLTYSLETSEERVSECVICLTEFRSGDEIRVLPQCGHGFHVTCIDTWFGSHSSCPSCRMVLVAGPPRCRECGEVRVGGSDGTRVVDGEISRSIDGLVV